MKTFRTMLPFVFAGFGVAIMLVCLGCNRKEPAKQNEVPPPGTVEETWKFWESLNKAATTGTGVEALNSPAWQGNVDTADICAVLEDIIEGTSTPFHRHNGHHSCASA